MNNFWDEQKKHIDSFERWQERERANAMEAALRDAFRAVVKPEPSYLGRWEFLTLEDMRFLLACGIDPA